MAKQTTLQTKNPQTPRAIALDLIDSIITHNQHLQDAIEKNPDFANLEPRDRRFARRITSTTLRHYGECNAYLKRYLDRMPSGANRKASYILLMATAEIIILEASHHAAVDQAVTLAKQNKLAHLSGLINAVLRKIATNAEKIRTEKPKPLLNLPPWLKKALIADYGKAEAEAVASSLMHPPALDLTAKDNPKKWAQKLEGRFIPPHTIRLADAHVPSLPGYEEGAWWVQDIAATLPVRILVEALGGNIHNKRIADLCAAPGGKTAQLLALGGEVIAIDKSSKRMERFKSNMERLNLNPQTIVADATRWKADAPLDAVLIDAPCSSSGTCRRNPDILAHEKSPDFAKLNKLQHDLLDASVSMLKPNGIAIYAVCSLLKQEGENIVANPPKGLSPLAIASLPEGFNATPQGHTLRVMPHQFNLDSAANIPQGSDGFFIACFRRLASSAE